MTVSQMTMSAENTSDIAPHVETEEQHIQPSPSSAAGPSTATDPSLQQASAPPKDGSIHVPADQIKKPSEVNRDDPNINVVELPSPQSPTFKGKVYGYSRLIRGKMFGQPDVKEHGAQVLRGEQAVPVRRSSQSSK